MFLKPEIIEKVSTRLGMKLIHIHPHWLSQVIVTIPGGLVLTPQVTPTGGEHLFTRLGDTATHFHGCPPPKVGGTMRLLALVCRRAPQGGNDHWYWSVNFFPYDAPLAHMFGIVDAEPLNMLILAEGQRLSPYMREAVVEKFGRDVNDAKIILTQPLVEQTVDMLRVSKLEVSLTQSIAPQVGVNARTFYAGRINDTDVRFYEGMRPRNGELIDALCLVEKSGVKGSDSFRWLLSFFPTDGATAARNAACANLPLCDLRIIGRNNPPAPYRPADVAKNFGADSNGTHLLAINRPQTLHLSHHA